MTTQGRLSVSPSLRAAGTPLPPETAASEVGPWYLYVAVWGFLLVVSIILVRLGVPWAVPGGIIAMVTLGGILWRPLFGICLMMALAPVGPALGVAGLFTAERGVGILLALGSIHYMLAHRSLRLFSTPVLALVAYVGLGLLSVFWAEYSQIVLLYLPTPVQILIFVVLFLAICHDENDLRWPLRLFAASCVLAAIVPRLLGLTAGEEERYTIAAMGEQAGINPNLFGANLGLGFITSVYLFRKDAGRMWRWLWVAGMAILPVAILMTGSRKAALFLAAPLILPVLSLRVLTRRPWAVFGVALALAVLVAVGLFTLKYVLPERIAWRLTDPTYLMESYQTRYELIRDSVAYASRHPLGAGLRCFHVGVGLPVHNALFSLLGDLGFPGAVLYVGFVAAMVIAVLRMKAGMEKWYAVGILAYLLLLDLGGDWMLTKHYWTFMSVAWLLAAAQKQPAALTGTDLLAEGAMAQPPAARTPVPLTRGE